MARAAARETRRVGYNQKLDNHRVVLKGIFP